jgi:hypothetical protein
MGVKKYISPGGVVTYTKAPSSIALPRMLISTSALVVARWVFGAVSRSTIRPPTTVDSQHGSRASASFPALVFIVISVSRYLI